MIFKDYYKILGLSTSKATNEEIKQAYREQAKKYHPDINSDNGRYELEQKVKQKVLQSLFLRLLPKIQNWFHPHPKSL